VLAENQMCRASPRQAKIRDNGGSRISQVSTACRNMRQ